MKIVAHFEACNL